MDGKDGWDWVWMVSGGVKYREKLPLGQKYKNKSLNSLMIFN